MEALTDYMKDRPEIKNVYLLNQNYSHGHQIARVAKELLARKRPDIKIVGEDLHAARLRCAIFRRTSPRSALPMPTL